MEILIQQTLEQLKNKGNWVLMKRDDELELTTYIGQYHLTIKNASDLKKLNNCKIFSTEENIDVGTLWTVRLALKKGWKATRFGTDQNVEPQQIYLQKGNVLELARLKGLYRTKPRLF